MLQTQYLYFLFSQGFIVLTASAINVWYAAAMHIADKAPASEVCAQISALMTANAREGMLYVLIMCAAVPAIATSTVGSGWFAMMVDAGMYLVERFKNLKFQYFPLYFWVYSLVKIKAQFWEGRWPRIKKFRKRILLSTKFYRRKHLSQIRI